MEATVSGSSGGAGNSFMAASGPDNSQTSNAMPATHSFGRNLPILISGGAGQMNAPTNVNRMPNAAVNHHTELMRILASGRIKQDVSHLFSIMVNMIQHMHIALFHAPSRHALEDSIIEQVMRVTYAMIMAYDTYHRGIQSRYNTLCGLQLHLPRLESITDPFDLRSAVILWIERLRAVKAISKAECLLYFHFAEFYEEQVYHAFLQKHRADPEHDIWELAAHLNSVYAVVEDVAILSRQFAAASEIVRQSIYTAIERLNETPQVWLEDYKASRYKLKLERKNAEAKAQSEMKLARSAEIKDLKEFQAKVGRDIAAKSQNGSPAAPLKRQPATRKASWFVPRRGLKKREYTL